MTIEEIVVKIIFVYGPDAADEYRSEVEAILLKNPGLDFDPNSDCIQEIFKKVTKRALDKQFENVYKKLGLPTNSYPVHTTFDEE